MCSGGWGGRRGCPGGHVYWSVPPSPGQLLGEEPLRCGITPSGSSTLLKRGNLDRSCRGCVRRRAEGGGERLEGPNGLWSGHAPPGQFSPPNGGITPVLSWVGDGHMAEATPRPRWHLDPVCLDSRQPPEAGASGTLRLILSAPTGLRRSPASGRVARFRGHMLPPPHGLLSAAGSWSPAPAFMAGPVPLTCPPPCGPDQV